MVRIKFGAGQIMNAVATLLDQIIELFNARLTTIINLARRTRSETTGKDRKYKRSENCREIVVKGAVYKNIIGREPLRTQC